jgi:hypothetical protein
MQSASALLLEGEAPAEPDCLGSAGASPSNRNPGTGRVFRDFSVSRFPDLVRWPAAA